ncbi:MAG: hypothetical protein ABR975_10045 [Vulcanimicrobiaceae bacterium]
MEQVARGGPVGEYGFFSYYTVMPSGVAWETFGPANGIGSYAEMRDRLGSLRRRPGDDDAGCVGLSESTLLPQREQFDAPCDWRSNI